MREVYQPCVAAQLDGDIARAILFSLPLHLFMLTVFEWLEYSGWIHTTLNFDTAFRVVSGEYEGAFSATIANFYANTRYLVAYYMSTLMVAVGAGYVLRKIVWNWKWDVNYPWLFRYKNDWLYTLMGCDVPAPEEYRGVRIYVRVEALISISHDRGGGEVSTLSRHRRRGYHRRQWLSPGYFPDRG